MTLSAAHLLATVVSTRFAAYTARLSRLRIDYPSTGMRVSPQPYSQAFTQSRVESLPRTVYSPNPDLSDPDGNGIELAYDRPREEWFDSRGNPNFKVEPFDPRDLLVESGPTS